MSKDKKTKSRKQFLLQDRDVVVLRWVSEQKFASLEQVQRRFWPANEGVVGPERVCYRRLLTLVHSGHLESRKFPQEKLYQLGKDGMKLLRDKRDDVLPYLEEIDLKNFRHDLAVNEVRIALEQLGARNWQSDRRIRQHKPRPHTPDAIFDVGGGTRVALEVELSQKAADRYPAINLEYENHFQDVNAILYLGFQGQRCEKLR